MQPLVTTSWLADRLNDPALRIVDLRWYLANPTQGRSEYAAAHIPGAVYFDVETDLSAPTGRGRHPLPDPSTVAVTLGSAGIGNDHTVIGYDSAGGAVAARLWWMLRHLGHGAVAVLDGGWQAWTEAGLPTTRDVTHHVHTAFDIEVREDDLIDRETLLENLGKVRLIDARAPERYRGLDEPIDPVAGHIPTAINRPYADNLGDDGRFRHPETLRTMYTSDATTSVAYCGSGVTACHTLLAHAVAGLPEPMLYGGSWSDWSRAGLAVAVGPEPGRP